MLGQPVYFLTPDVVGVELTGRLREGVTATDLVLTVTEMLRKEKVVGKFVEFFGEGAASLAGARPRDDRQHGARVRRDDGLLPGRRRDHRVLRGHRPHRRGDRRVRGLLQGAGPVRHPARRRDRLHARSSTLDLATRHAVASPGPKRPQDRIELGSLKSKFTELFSKPVAENGFAQAGRQARPALSSTRLGNGRRRRDQRRIAAAARTAPSRATSSRWSTTSPTPDRVREPAAPSYVADRQRRRADRRDHVVHQHVEPERAARRRPAREEGRRAGLTVKPHIKTSLAPGSRVVTEYLDARPACCPTSRSSASTSRPTAARPASATPATSTPRSTRRSSSNDLVCAAVLSGNRNFEARIHPNLKANFLASPPLVVAYAIAGTRAEAT